MGRVGAGNRVRTGDLNLGKVALYQLSYSRNSEVRSPQQRSAKKVASPRGFEPLLLP